MEFNVGKNLKVLVENGQYGPYVKLVRGERWIVLSHSQWVAIGENIEKIKTEGLKLSTEKEINVVDFSEAQYISFHRIRKYNEKVYDCYINLNAIEWEEFVKLVPAITYQIGDMIQKEGCQACTKTTVKLYDGRMKETRLKPEFYQLVKQNNSEVQNQLGLICEYCGASGYLLADDCHCHRFDCKSCEPTNFCCKCNQLKVHEA